MTHASLFDNVCNLYKELLVLLGVLAAHQNLDRELVGLDLVEIFGCSTMSVLNYDAAMRLFRWRTFLGSREDVECVEGEQHQGGGELVAKQPELWKRGKISILRMVCGESRT